MNEKERLLMCQQIMLELKGAKPSKAKFEEGLEDSCWEGYIAYGTKEVDGKTVPNCIPEKDVMSIVKEGFPIPSPSGEETESEFISRCMSEIGGEYDQPQSLAICYSKWREE